MIPAKRFVEGTSVNEILGGEINPSGMLQSKKNLVMKRRSLKIRSEGSGHCHVLQKHNV